MAQSGDIHRGIQGQKDHPTQADRIISADVVGYSRLTEGRPSGKCRMKKFRVTVIGGGSVGLCVAASFAQAGADVWLMVREAQVEALSQQPIIVTGLLGECRLEPNHIIIEDAARPSRASRDCHVLVVTTKAFDVAKVLQPFVATPRPHSVLLMQNGLGSAEIAREVMGDGIPIISSAMLIGMQRDGVGRVSVKAHSSPVWIGSLHGDELGLVQSILEVGNLGFLPMEHEPEIQKTMYSKVLFNTCMNPTGALIGGNYGELLENEHSRALITNLADETLRVYAASADLHLAENGQQYVDEILSPLVFPRSTAHRSSMVQDIENGRLTEIDFLNGAIVKMGRDVGINTPFHQSIVLMIHAREKIKNNPVT